MIQRKLIEELLTLLERKESRLLEWGFLDVSSSAEEIIETFRGGGASFVRALDELLANSSDKLFVANLVEANLITRVGDNRYRSRFAESIRLLGRLRQRFSNDDWASAPQLVSDLKIHLSARTYPKRDINIKYAWEQIQGACWDVPIQKFVFETLTKSEGKELNLASFQVRATQCILSNYQPKIKSAGTVISAGTGSGKTKAFYLPAFMGIAADIAKDSREYTKVLAVYPRNVLLADQFTEALTQAKILFNAGGPLNRPVTFGAYLGDTPRTSNDFRLSPFMRWKRSGTGWVPPFIKHPDDGSGLVWLDIDRLVGRTTLCSENAPDQVVFPNGMVRLTRDQIRQHPPDILMMSLEMLNKEMSSSVNAVMLGFNANLPAPRLVLLDEIHTYEGISGAQVPWILRRWLYWVKRLRSSDANPHFVGLSATLKEATRHLSTLTGTPEFYVTEIKPEISLGELESEGIEYNVALKSHPGSGVSVLGTSIQTVMLGARILTPSNERKCNCGEYSDDLSPQCFFGRKVFGFTDNLDSLHRWMADFVDADRTRRLSKFRISTDFEDIYSSRFLEGQVWKLSEDLGHNLKQALSTSSCSSRTPGVDSNSDVVIATSSLEVGYDDPDVGMIVQHKAPRSAASFLQRKGRAGRQRGIRPWTLVVLSDHGRDRWAFRDSERIFHPELNALKIPALNPYVVRIQATQFLIDWIGNRVGQGEPYRYLTKSDPTLGQQAKKLLNELLTDDTRRGEFVRDVTCWIQSSSVGLQLSDPKVLTDSILWDPPRAVLRHAIPELAKILAGDFIPLDEISPIKQKRPLPLFIPSATFGELDAQDVEIQIDGHHDTEIVDIALALREAVPCRVSRRYVPNVREKSLWHDYSGTILINPPKTLSVAKLFPESLAIGCAEGIEILQPQTLRLTKVPDSVRDSSSGSWIWKFKADFIGTQERLGLVEGPVLSRVFSSCEGYFHRRYAHVVVTRFASQFKYEVVRDSGDKQRGIVDLITENIDGVKMRQAVGFRRLVDALRFKISPSHIASIPVLDKMALQRLRPHYFRYRLSNSPLLNSTASSFGIGALWSTSVAMLAATALLKNKTLKESTVLLSDRSAAARKVLECMLSGEVASDLTDQAVERTGSRANKRIKEIQELWQNNAVREEICRLESTLWDPQVEGIDEWLIQIYLETLANALEQTIWSVIPEIPEGDITVDISSSDIGYELIVSEVASGGVGHLERLVAEINNGSERFDTCFETAIRSCENDRLTRLLLSSVEKARSDESNIPTAFEQVRSAISFHDLDSAKHVLIRSLSKEGLATDRSSISALVSKVLRPGSSPVTDMWVRNLSRRCAKLSERIGISLDQRVFAYWCVQTPSMNRRMKSYLHKIGNQDPTPDQLFNSFVQLTHIGCADSCLECLGSRKEMEGLIPSRWLAETWINLESIDFHINVDETLEWKVILTTALRKERRIKLFFADIQRMKIAKELSQLLAEEHDRGYIFSPFSITSVIRVSSNWEITLHPNGELIN